MIVKDQGGEIKSKGFTINGLKEGYSIEYYKNGYIRGKIPYKKGKMDGVAYTYFESGEVESKKHLQNDSLNGILIRFSKIGDTTFVGTYKNNKKNGLVIQKYVLENVNVQVLDSTHYKMGEEHGNSKLYRYYDNKLLIDSKYINGEYVEGYHYNYDPNHNDIDYRKNTNGIYRTYDYPQMTLKRVESYSQDGISRIEFIPRGMNRKYKVEKIGTINFLTKEDSTVFNTLYGKGW